LPTYRPAYLHIYLPACITAFKTIKILLSNIPLRKFGKLWRIAPYKTSHESRACTKTKKYIFPKKTEKRKKEKESNFTGRDADRPKGNGISPEGWFVRDEQNIMP